MLFTKKKIFFAGEKIIKEELKDENGKTVLKINLHFPKLECPKGDPLLKNALPYYEKLSEGFAEYARGALFNSAKIAASLPQTNFKPFSALARFEITLENQEHLSVMTDMSVSDGINEPSVERKTEVWNRKTGQLCKLDDFADKSKLLEAIGKEHRKKLRFPLFVLRENSVEVFIKNGNRFEKFSQKIEKCIEC